MSPNTPWDGQLKFLAAGLAGLVLGVPFLAGVAVSTWTDCEPQVVTEIIREGEFTDAEQRYLDTLNSLAAVELLKIATAKDSELYDDAYTARVRAAYEWACDNTIYLGGQKTYTEAELFGDLSRK